MDGLNDGGFSDLRSTHTVLLSHMLLSGDTLTAISKKAGMTKQAMGRLADDLVQMKYLKKRRSLSDRREIELTLTKAGHRLMSRSFTVMDDVQRRCKNRVGVKKFEALLRTLDAIEDELRK